jgi:4-hydroxy-2-oxoheptanedioate aldolase
MGVFLGLPSPTLTELMGLAGFDFVILDTEHGVFNPPVLEDCMRAATAASLPCIVRIPRLDAASIQSALDIGADGIQVPQLETAQEAADAVRFSHFPPSGERGHSSTTRAAQHGCLTRAEVIANAAANTLVAVQIESRAAVEDLDTILQVPGVDVVFIGTGDLSLELGYDSPNHPGIQALVDEMVPAIVAAGKVAGVFLSDWAQLAHLQELGVRYFAVSAGLIFKQALVESVSRFAASNTQIIQTTEESHG